MLTLLAGWLLAGAASTAAFTASLLVTNQPGTLFMRWEQGEKLELANVVKARRGEPQGPSRWHRGREHRFAVDPAKSTDVPQWSTKRPKPSLVGFWKDHCEDEFGLKIEPAGRDQYSISFCGPGGCFEPGTYRPNSPIFGDQDYRVIDADTLEVLGGDGFSTYYRCPAPAKK